MGVSSAALRRRHPKKYAKRPDIHLYWRVSCRHLTAIGRVEANGGLISTAGLAPSNRPSLEVFLGIVPTWRLPGVACSRRKIQ